MHKTNKANKTLFDWTNDAAVSALSKEMDQKTDEELKILRDGAPLTNPMSGLQTSPPPMSKTHEILTSHNELCLKVALINDKLDLILQLFQMKREVADDAL
jgi:hypothetical protein